MFAQITRKVASIRTLSLSLVAAGLVASSFATTALSQPKRDQALPHFVGFQEGTVSGGKTTIHLKIAGATPEMPFYVVFKEPNGGRSYQLSLIPGRRQTSFEFDWVIPAELRASLGKDRLSIKNGVEVVYDREQGVWTHTSGGSMVRVPAEPSSKEKF